MVHQKMKNGFVSVGKTIFKKNQICTGLRKHSDAVAKEGAKSGSLFGKPKLETRPFDRNKKQCM
jgi:hypothetical protein